MASTESVDVRPSCIDNAKSSVQSQENTSAQQGADVAAYTWDDETRLELPDWTQIPPVQVRLHMT